MYLVYSLLTLVVFVVVSPYFLYQAVRYKKYIGSLRQRLGYLPITLQRRRRGVDLDSRRLGRRGADGARARRRPARRAIRGCGCSCRRRRSPASRWRGATCSRSTRVFYFPFDWAFIVRRTLDIVKPRAVRDDGDRDLAEPAAHLPRARREDDRHQRPHLVAIVSALPADPAVLPARARRRRSLLHAERRIGAAADRSRRRSVRASRSPAA